MLGGASHFIVIKPSAEIQRSGTASKKQAEGFSILDTDFGESSPPLFLLHRPPSFRFVIAFLTHGVM
jgi:hypothetical protein